MAEVAEGGEMFRSGPLPSSILEPRPVAVVDQPSSIFYQFLAPSKYDPIHLFLHLLLTSFFLRIL
jgi:hypothetical protein